MIAGVIEVGRRGKTRSQEKLSIKLYVGRENKCRSFLVTEVTITVVLRMLLIFIMLREKSSIYTVNNCSQVYTLIKSKAEWMCGVFLHKLEKAHLGTYKKLQ